MHRPLLLLAVFLACVTPLRAQLEVGLQIKRNFLMVHEPIVATITIKNLAGRDITLTDTPTQSWFSFQVFRDRGQLMPPLDQNYRLDPLTIHVGETLKRSVVLNSLYPMREVGEYKVCAVAYFAAIDKFYQSAPVILELSEGKTIWQQTVGVPEGMEGAGSTRKYSLLTFRQLEHSSLYARVEDVDSGTVYCNLNLGRVLTGMKPEAQIDINNNLNILQVAGPRTYYFSRIDVKGELLANDTYYSTQDGPAILKRDAGGSVAVARASLQPNELTAGDRMKSANKLSDRPVQLPKE